MSALEYCTYKLLSFSHSGFYSETVHRNPRVKCDSERYSEPNQSHVGINMKLCKSRSLLPSLQLGRRLSAKQERKGLCQRRQLAGHEMYVNGV